MTVKSFSCATNCFPEITYPSTQCILHTLFLSYRNHDYGSRHDEENLLVIKGLVGCSCCEFKGGRNLSSLNWIWILVWLCCYGVLTWFVVKQNCNNCYIDQILLFQMEVNLLRVLDKWYRHPFHNICNIFQMLREYRRRGLHHLQISLLSLSKALQEGYAELNATCSISTLHCMAVHALNHLNPF